MSRSLVARVIPAVVARATLVRRNGGRQAVLLQLQAVPARLDARWPEGSHPRSDAAHPALQAPGPRGDTSARAAARLRHLLPRGRDDREVVGVRRHRDAVRLGASDRRHLRGSAGNGRVAPGAGNEGECAGRKSCPSGSTIRQPSGHPRGATLEPARRRLPGEPLIDRRRLPSGRWPC